MRAERRATTRHVENGCVAITILWASHNPDLEGRTFFCRTGDVSIDSLSFDLYCPIPIDAVLDLNIQLSAPVEQFKHRGSVQRCTAHHNGADACSVGVKLEDAQGHTVVEWHEAVERRQSLVLSGYCPTPSIRSATGR